MYEVRVMSGSNAFTSANWTVSGTAMTADSPFAIASAVDVSAWQNETREADTKHTFGYIVSSAKELTGAHQVGVRYRDAAGNYGETTGFATAFEA